DRQQISGRAGQPVELGHDQRVALADELDHVGKPRALGSRRDAFAENLLAAGRLEVAKLRLEPGLLLRGRNPSVSDDHGAPPITRLKDAIIIAHITLSTHLVIGVALSISARGNELASWYA